MKSHRTKWLAISCIALCLSCSESGGGLKDAAVDAFDGPSEEPALSAEDSAMTETEVLSEQQDWEESEQKQLWGWVSVLELNDATLNEPTGWSQGLRACFTASPDYQRSLDFQFYQFVTQVKTIGSCTLYANQWVYPFDCSSGCDYFKEECTMVGDVPTCQPLPPTWNLGTIALDGLKQNVQLSADELGRYSTNTISQDWFDLGDVITVSSSGGQFQPLSLTATGTAPLEIESKDVPLVRNQPVTIRWTPADADSRIQISLQVGPHRPSRPRGSIYCDLEDSASQVEIAAELINGLMDRTDWGIQRFSHIVRYRRQIQTPYGQPIELLVGSVRTLNLVR